MADNKKPKVDLEKVVSEGVSYLLTDATDKEADITKKINPWMQYIVKEYGEEQANDSYEILKSSPLALSPEDVTGARDKHEGNLVKEVKKDAKTVFSKLDVNSAIPLSLDYIGTDAYQTIRKEVIDDGNIKNAFAGAYDNDLWRNLVMGASGEAVKEAATLYVGRTQNREIEENLFNKGKYDNKKAAGYVCGKVSKKDSKEQNIFYLQTGLAYTQTKMAA